MTKLAFVGDVHLGNHRRFGGPVAASINRRCRAALAVFERAVLRARELGCCALIVDGDLFDTDRPEPQLLSEVQRILSPVVRPSPDPFEVVLLVGNHDQTSMTRGDHALGPLLPCARIVEAPELLVLRGVELLCVPFRPGEPAKDWLPGALSGILTARGELVGPVSPTGPRLLALHLGVSDAQTPRWLLDSPDSIDAAALISLCGAHGIEAVFAGNWHDRKQWAEDVFVFQTGALVPTGFDNPGVEGYGTLAFWEDDGQQGVVSFEELPGPRFAKVGTERAAREAARAARAAEHSLYLSWTAAPDDLDAARAVLDGLVLAGDVVDGEVLADAAVAEASARSAAHAARSSSSLDEAIDHFVGLMSLDELVDRAELRARVRRYLGA